MTISHKDIKIIRGRLENKLTPCQFMG